MEWPFPALMLVTDRGRCRGDLLSSVEGALAGGVNVVQVREKERSTAERAALCLQLRALTLGRAVLLVNGCVETAAACCADGVHLPEGAASVAAVRATLGKGSFVGRSVHGVEAARAAAAEGADYLLVGPLFPSRSHPGQRPAGMSLLEVVVQAVPVPVLGIGGIGPEEAALCRRAGAAGVAVVDAILAATDPAAAARQLRRALEASA